MSLIRGRQLGLSMLFASAVVLAGCGDSADGGTDMGGDGDAEAKDRGADDATDPDAPGTDMRQDGGRTDSGRDATISDTPASDVDGGIVANCPMNSEGCPCTPDPMGMQGSCEPNMLCVTWDAMDGPSTCVRNCDNDTACAASTVGNTLCREIGLPSNICVSAESTDDEFCRGALVARNGRTDPPLGPGPMLGCRDGADCLVNLFGDIESFEGLCLQLCAPTPADPSGGCVNPLPYCRPNFVTVTSSTGQMQSFGHCATAQILAGGRCVGNGLTQRCDTASTSGDLACIGNPISQVGEGFCMEFCTLATPDCVVSDPAIGAATCVPISEMVLTPPCTTDAQCMANGGFDTCDTTRAPATCVLNQGICNLDCTNHAQNCSLPGAAGLGQVCIDNLIFDPNFPLQFCVDRIPTPLIETLFEFDASSMMAGVRQAGDNCEARQGDALRCPNNTFCLAQSMTAGSCIRGCNSSTTTAVGRGGCETGTSSSAACIGGFLADPDEGLCMEPI